MGTKIIFCSSEKSEVLHELTAFRNTLNELFIEIADPTDDSGYGKMFIALDKYTAIKLVKHLKREIAEIIEVERLEVDNG
jgi:hypothetical protein